MQGLISLPALCARADLVGVQITGHCHISKTDALDLRLAVFFFFEHTTMKGLPTLPASDAEGEKQ